jgi:hypothetical protein
VNLSVDLFEVTNTCSAFATTNTVRDAHVGGILGQRVHLREVGLRCVSTESVKKKNTLLHYVIIHIHNNVKIYTIMHNTNDIKKKNRPASKW